MQQNLRSRNTIGSSTKQPHTTTTTTIATATATAATVTTTSAPSPDRVVIDMSGHHEHNYRGSGEEERQFLRRSGGALRGSGAYANAAAGDGDGPAAAAAAAASSSSANLDHNRLNHDRKYLSASSSAMQRPPRSAIGDEWRSLLLLVTLYCVQGVPLGLSFGALPFILKSKLSYSALGIFSFASYPYSLKLLWAPIVDGVYSKEFGRRKSWIVPAQFVCAFIFFWIATWIDSVLKEDADGSFDIYQFTVIFFLLVVVAATQDVAVDGWAVEMLPRHLRSYASTTQTVGLQVGFFLSFTVLLALNSPDFSNKYLRATPQGEGVLSLSAYLWFWGVVYLVLNFYLLFFKTEQQQRARSGSSERDGTRRQRAAAAAGSGAASQKAASYSVSDDDDDDKASSDGGGGNAAADAPGGVKGVYRKMWTIIRLPNVRTLLCVLLLVKIGLIVGDAVTPLKLLEKGFAKQDLALFALIDLPFQIMIAIWVGRWTSRNSPVQAYQFGYVGRVTFGVVGALLVYAYPGNAAGEEVSWTWFLLIMCGSISYSCFSNIMFVAQGSLYANISDPSIGGSYLTMLNTISNLGGTWPKALVLMMVDTLTSAQCVGAAAAGGDAGSGDGSGGSGSGGGGAALGVATLSPCSLDASAKQACANAGGTCVVLRDGYYLVVAISLLYSTFFYFKGVKQYFLPLASLPPSAWTSTRDKHNRNTKKSRYDEDMEEL